MNSLDPILDCIYIIDDDYASTFYHKLLIKKGDYANVVMSFSSVETAIDHFFRRGEDYIHPDLILLDLNMPALGGWDFLEAIQNNKSIFSPLPSIIIVSASVNLEDRIRADESDLVFDYLSKPISNDALVKIIKKHLVKTRVN